MHQAGLPPALLIITLAVSLICAGLMLPRWVALQVTDTPRAGAGWGILGPFLMMLVLLVCGLLAHQLLPGFDLVKQSLLQALKDTAL